MLSATNKTTMLSVILQSVVILNVIVLGVIVPVSLC
jgi:hypothetical protein